MLAQEVEQKAVTVQQFQSIMIIKLNTTPTQVMQAREKAEDMGRLNNSIRSGQGNMIGFLGEIVVCDYLGADSQNTYDYDLVHRGVKIDVKTKECTSPPLPHYECSVAAYNTFQACNAYVFVRVCLPYAWILGWRGKEEYYSMARKLTKGQIDPSNNFTVKADCYNLPISDLRCITKIK